MKIFSITSILLICLINQLEAQNITIQPYLQDASPNSINILWETDSVDESIVEWGLTDKLGFTTTGIAYPSDGDARVH